MNSSDTSRPEFNEECMDLIKTGYDYLALQQELIEEQYQIGSFENWYYDQTTGLLTFSDGDTVKIEIDYEEVGSISKKSNTWLWAWANPHIEEKVKSKIVAIKEFGIKNDLEPLIKRKWNGDEYDGWEMAGVSAYLLKAKGAYRVPTENTFSFMIFKEIRDLRGKEN